jgi:hypothetical protein
VRPYRGLSPSRRVRGRRRFLEMDLSLAEAWSSSRSQERASRGSRTAKSSEAPSLTLPRSARRGGKARSVPSPGTPGEGWGEGDFECQSALSLEIALTPHDTQQYERRISEVIYSDVLSQIHSFIPAGPHPCRLPMGEGEEASEKDLGEAQLIPIVNESHLTDPARMVDLSFSTVKGNRHSADCWVNSLEPRKSWMIHRKG